MMNFTNVCVSVLLISALGGCNGAGGESISEATQAVTRGGDDPSLGTDIAAPSDGVDGEDPANPEEPGKEEPSDLSDLPEAQPDKDFVPPPPAADELEKQAAGTGAAVLTQVTPEYSWNQGDVPTTMSPASNTVCFLVRVTGKFSGGGEEVKTYIQNGIWYLGGASKQFGVSATARCLHLNAGSTYTPEVGWSQGQPGSFMAPEAGNACFLTRMTGKFRGGGEALRISPINGGWVMGGSSHQVAVGGGGRCVSIASVSPESSWSQGNSATFLDTVNNRACFLTGVTGNSQGGGESVHVTNFGVQQYWYLTGTSAQAGVAGNARCAHY